MSLAKGVFPGPHCTLSQTTRRLIHNARIGRNLTQQALAALVGTGQKTISRIETGQPGTKLDTLFGILAALDLDMQIAPRSKGGADLSEIF